MREKIQKNLLSKLICFKKISCLFVVAFLFFLKLKSHEHSVLCYFLLKFYYLRFLFNFLLLLFEISKYILLAFLMEQFTYTRKWVKNSNKFKGGKEEWMSKKFDEMERLGVHLMKFLERTFGVRIGTME